VVYSGQSRIAALRAKAWKEVKAPIDIESTESIDDLHGKNPRR
jgi:hypothetical protein